MSTSGNAYIDALIWGHNFADLLCDAAGLGAYVSLGQVAPNGNSIVSMGGWAGRPDPSSRAPYIATAKLAELIWYGKYEGLSLTPVPGLEISLGWMGGARYDNDIVAVSKWAQEHDRLLALVVLYSLTQETRLHHVGYRFATEQEMRMNAAGHGTEPIEVPADDHLRLYRPVPDVRSPYGKYYVESQYFPEGPHSQAMHWDLVTQDPEGLLDFVARAYGVQPKFWEAGENDPVGVVWVTAAKDGTIFGVMARSRFWEAEK